MRSCLVLLALLVPALPAMAADCVVTLDGKPLAVPCVSLVGTPDSPDVGDLVLVADVWIKLDRPGPLELRTARKPWGRHLVAGNPGRVVAVCVDRACPGDPLAGLSATQSRALRGLYVRHPVADLAAVLARIDRARCAVTLVDFVAQGPEKAIPELPPDIENLALFCCFSDGFADFDRLARLTELRVLIASGMSLPISVLAGMRSLRALRAHFTSFDTARIEGLRELRSLEMRSHHSVGDLAFVRKLPELRVLDVSSTSVKDVSPLADHPALSSLAISWTPVKSLRPISGHPTLRRIVARRSQLTLLPEGKSGALEFVDALATRVTDAEAASFRKNRPGCRLFHRLMDPLREAVKGADGLRLRRGGMCCRVGGERERVLFETRDRSEILALLRTLSLVEPDPDEELPPCECCGAMTLEFRCDERLLVGISIHHATALRWKGWGEDAPLTEHGAKALGAWIRARVEGEIDWD